MKSVRLIAALLFTSLFAAAQEGSWTITDAKTMSGKAYSGTVSFSKFNEVWKANWKTSEGDYQGVGIMKGNEFYGGWGKDKLFGVMIYQEKDGKLFGEWTYFTSDGKIGEEWVYGATLKKMEGSFDVSGNYPAPGRDYKGVISIVKNGEIYDVTWTTDKVIYFGIGILYEKYFVVGWSYDFGFGAIQYKFSGKKAKGKWSASGRKILSYENLKKEN